MRKHQQARLESLDTLCERLLDIDGAADTVLSRPQRQVHHIDGGRLHLHTSHHRTWISYGHTVFTRPLRQVQHIDGGCLHLHTSHLINLHTNHDSPTNHDSLTNAQTDT